MDKLFRPKGTTQEINLLLSAIKETEASLRQDRDSIVHFNETNEALTILEEQLAVLELQLPDIRLRTAELQGAFDLREWWLKGQALLLEEVELRKVLPDPSVPLLAQEARSVWESLKGNRSEAADNLAKARKAEFELRLAREAISWDEGFVALLPELERLESVREGIVARREEGAELESERRLLDESVKGMLARLSPDWTEADLQAFGGLSAERDQVRRLQQQWEEAERAAESLQADVRRITRQLHALQVEPLIERRQEGERGAANESYRLSFIPRSRSDLLKSWHALEDAIRQYEGARMEALLDSAGRIQYQRRKPAGLLYGVAGIAATAAAAMPFLAGKDNPVPPTYLTLSAILIAAAAGVVLLAFRQSSRPAAVHSSGKDGSVRIHRRQMAERLSRLVSDNEAAAALLAESNEDDLTRAQIEDGVWVELRNAVYREIERLDAENELQLKHTETQTRLQELSRERSVIEKDLKQLNDRLSALQEEWQTWLQARKLPLHLTPDSLPELLGLTEQGRTSLRQRERIIERLAAVGSTIDQFEEAAAKVCEQYPPPAAFGHDSVLAVHGLFREALRQQTAKEEALRVDRLLSAAVNEAERAGRELTRVENVIATFFSGGWLG
ncbi:hypothetical protein SD71_04425 [Cohnella kolymensis]|uniref:Death domain-containing protein n=1 Tax=Cohnella kolymensis TaxID=1590652 RepID=A0ABR5A7B6_9BACL|nr:hypothetical protein [Cohnella kolymensis]KIL36961.1 hypothetical protein SD71_04425 [Cohnella kolymensis]